MRVLEEAEREPQRGDIEGGWGLPRSKRWDGREGGLPQALDECFPPEPQARAFCVFFRVPLMSFAHMSFLCFLPHTTTIFGHMFVVVSFVVVPFVVVPFVVCAIFP